ncbi:transcriptional regulator with XRE-family HTH domain [Clostridium beijerinckii]|uniref:helix-turn-helix domain-containing protein n=1 Tax=Clostridium beijerinckii TaxID=1520 RepID=UPI001494B67B|nr:helix-turn-helix transcriptional regulator [Clostridium beijerinckii]NOW86750.1 transcriptional regulator with XRE-family HTH domain [Clostridium beijerinckii]
MSDISVIGENIQKIRSLKGVSAYEVAKRAGVGAATISEIESGKRKSLKSNTLEKIAAALGVSANDLMGDTETISFETDNIQDIVNIIDYIQDPILDSSPMTQNEKKDLLNGIETILNSIRYKRLKK